VTNGIPLGCPFSYRFTCKLCPNTEGISRDARQQSVYDGFGPESADEDETML
jgi:hypothetical protein